MAVPVILFTHLAVLLIFVAILIRIDIRLLQVRLNVVLFVSVLALTSFIWMTVRTILVFGIIIVNSMSAFSFEKILQIIETIVSILRFALRAFIPTEEDEKA